jgi:hypothetical protein
MKVDAVFYQVVTGFWYGKTRRGAIVKIRSTPGTDKLIQDAWGNVITVEISEPDNDQAMLGKCMEVTVPVKVTP